MGVLRMALPDDAHDPFISPAQAAPRTGGKDLADALPQVSGGGRRPVMLLRLIFLFLTAGGMVSAATLWAFGHGWLAARLIAGDVLLILGLLLAVSLL